MQDELHKSQQIKTLSLLVIAGSMVVFVLSGVLRMKTTPSLGETNNSLHSLSGVAICISVWGTLTGIGLLRACEWARISALVLSGFLALFGVFFLVIAFLMPNPAVHERDFYLVQTVGILSFLIPAVLGVLGLIFFTRNIVRAHFEDARMEPAGVAAPLPTSSVSFVVRLISSDIYRMQLWYTFKGSWSVWGFLVILALPAEDIVRWNAQENEAPTSNFELFFGVMALFVLLTVVIPLVIAHFRFKNNKVLQEDTRYIISTDRIETESSTGSSRFDWSRIARVVETKACFYLFQSKIPTFIFPKRNLSSETDIAKLREILRSCVKGKVQLQ